MKWSRPQVAARSGRENYISFNIVFSVQLLFPHSFSFQSLHNKYLRSIPAAVLVGAVKDFFIEKKIKKKNIFQSGAGQIGKKHSDSTRSYISRFNFFFFLKS